MSTLPGFTLHRPPKPVTKPRPQYWDGREFVCHYDYTDADGRLLFRKKRYRLDPEKWGRTKDFQILTPSPVSEHLFTLGGPEGMDRCMYRLPEVLRACDRNRQIDWCEGEDDADHLATVGRVATTNAMGANKVNAYQAAWLVAARRVVIWMDKDKEHPEVGAHDALMRYRALLEVGFTREIAIVMAGHPDDKDAADHVRRFGAVPPARVKLSKVERLAAAYRPATNRRLGYR